MVWVLTIGVLEVNPEWDSIRAQRGRSRSALFYRVSLKTNWLKSFIANKSGLAYISTVLKLTLTMEQITAKGLEKLVQKDGSFSCVPFLFGVHWAF